MCAADPGERALVAQERVELAPLAAQDRAERGSVDLVGLGPEVRELGIQRLRREEPHARASSSSLGEEQRAAVRELDLEHRPGGPFFPAGRYRRRPALIRWTRARACRRRWGRAGSSPAGGSRGSPAPRARSAAGRRS